MDYVKICEKTKCWIWTGLTVKPKNTIRAAFYYNGKKITAARWSYSNFVGKIKKGMFICHKCDNPMCVNPDHLFQGSHIDNMKDLYFKGLHKKGENHGMAKLTKEKVLKIIESKLTNKKCAEFFDVPISTVFNIRNGYTWSHTTGIERKYWKSLKIL